MLVASSLISPLRAALFAGAIGLAFTVSASAQDYDRYGNQIAYRDNGPEEITVYAPRHLPDRTYTGIPIENVALSQPVRYDDLDLSTRWGAHRLNVRVHETAQTLCRQLATEYTPVSGSNYDCIRDAVARTQDRVNAAIDRARGDY